MKVKVRKRNTEKVLAGGKRDVQCQLSLKTRDSSIALSAEQVLALSPWASQ